ncbi:MAG: TonB family protein [Bacteroidota bacterium]|nr:TonB family protein [Bacteroidota bacterium]
MTNSEILNSNLLEIVFENRNKEYGAYAIRKGYNNRLLLALGAGLSVIFLLILLTSAGKPKSKNSAMIDTKEGIVIRAIEMPKEKISEPAQPKATVKKIPVPAIAAVKYTTPPLIKKDSEVKEAMVAVNELEGKEISNTTTDGKEADHTVILEKEPVETPGNGIEAPAGPSQPQFEATERNPEFPGGPEGLKKFMTRYLTTPESLSAGEKKVVQVRFIVDKDGSVTGLEIASSGGAEFDREVMRVVRKMPRWIPALQNGIHISVNYMLPVTFIGTEE